MFLPLSLPPSLQSPFFGEEFQFSIPREFRFLSFYLYDRDRPMKTDKIIGKVSVKKESLSNFHGKDQWFSITPVDADSEVQGKIHLEISLKLLQHMNDNFQQAIQVVIKECSDLAVINGSCDPYATITMIYANQKEETRRTKNPFLNCSHDKENVYSLEDAAGFHELRFVLWHDSTGMFGNMFLGEVRIPVSDLSVEAEPSAWYFLQPRENASSRLSNKGDLGALRINLHYTSDTVFMSHCYDSFRNLILQSCSQKYNSSAITSSVAFLMGEVVHNKQEIAQPLTRILLQHGMIVPLLRDLASLEISKTSDANTLFRGNTLVSKCMDELMKLAGHHYLSEILKPIIDDIIRDKKTCEIDPARLSPTDNRELNISNLVEYIHRIIDAISQSALNCPPVMCQIFSELRELANTYFPSKQEVRYSVISSFVFLRFFAPAILGPRLFDLTTEHIDATTHRTLTLLSKAVQSIGNQVCFRNIQNSTKESYMKEVFDHCFNERANKMVEGVRTYLEIISQIPNGNQKAYGLPVTLKEGVMVKRAQGRKKFGIKNFKTRFFRLTTREFSYYKKKGGHPLCTIPVDKILAVEKVEESSFKCKNMFQLVQGNRTLYMQASNCVEEKEWIDLLTKVLQYNSHRLKQYHPGAYIHSHWLCCRATSETAPGCSAVSNYLDCNLKVQIDSDKEMERIFSLLSQSVEKLKKLQNACEVSVSLNSNEVRELSIDGFVIDDPSVAFKSLTSILSCMKELEQRHKVHQNTLLRTTRYGSKQAPIGDDNYLILASSTGSKKQQDNLSNTNSTANSLAKSTSFRTSSHKRC
ncbi:Ras GTPase-activating protein 3 [Armadillidium nasatum]|uniref:Ras GTPase-activating protein 3 n=1 Tax=Armadillidium nasatum TaxID=96803 RepID=A0A5N5SHJ7_9CRUS|nr:Ras GTPase-activating protein 3 [Armadillidium nasatum]